MFLIIASAVYLAYLILLMVKAYSELRSMPFFGNYIVLIIFGNALILTTTSLTDMRLKFLTLLVLFVLGISISVTFFRYGIGVLQDNFIAQLSTNYQNSSEFRNYANQKLFGLLVIGNSSFASLIQVALYGLLNFYIYTMAYVYSPTSNAVLGTMDQFKPLFLILGSIMFILLTEHSIMKDNPAFSMVNDSDEDVVYGSDDDGRKPLTINFTSKDDDSD